MTPVRMTEKEREGRKEGGREGREGGRKEIYQYQLLVRI